MVAALSTVTWISIAPGLEHRRLTVQGAEVEILRATLSNLRARVVVAEKSGVSARQLASAPTVLAAVNGGFFSAELKVVGLRRSGNQRLAGSLRRNLGALVWSDGEAPRVIMGSDLAALENASEVVQCGPRLVIDGAPNRLKRQVSRRTVIGVDRAGRMVILVTRRGLFEANELASWLARAEAEGGLGLVDALNLDGGRSSQMYVNAEPPIDVPGTDVVADGIVFYAR